jgi:hypothetical protein
MAAEARSESKIAQVLLERPACLKLLRLGGAAPRRVRQGCTFTLDPGSKGSDAVRISCKAQAKSAGLGAANGCLG